MLLDYTEGVKRSNEEIKHKHSDSLQLLSELQRQDWSKQIIDLKRENEVLREELGARQKEMGDIKQNLSFAMQGQTQN